MSNTILFLGLGIAVLVLGVFLGRTAGRAYLRYRGTRIVKCPETERSVAVEVDAADAAKAALRGRENVHLQDCTRWPERQNCGQECLAELEASPSDCLLKNILTRWYKGKDCTICRKPFGEIHWHDHKPCLIDDEGRTSEWNEFPPEAVHEVLESHSPLCWDCHIAEKFRREHPELVVDRS